MRLDDRMVMIMMMMIMLIIKEEEKKKNCKQTFFFVFFFFFFFFFWWWWWWWWWWRRGCHGELWSIKTAVSAALLIKRLRVLHKQQNWIQNDDSLAQNLTKKTVVSNTRLILKESISFSFLLNKPDGLFFFEIYQDSQRKQMWTKENRCASPY